MKLRDLLKSDFKHYQFLVSKKWFNFGDTIEWEKTKDDTTYGYLIRLDVLDKDNDYNFDLSYCVARDNHCTSVNWVVKIIEMSKMFEFDYMEHSDDTLFIHLKRKDK